MHTQGQTGHLLAAAGATEFLFTALACSTGRMPACANLYNIDERLAAMNIDFLLKPRDWNRPRRRRIALTNSFGFGGTNASICLASYEP